MVLASHVILSDSGRAYSVGGRNFEFEALMHMKGQFSIESVVESSITPAALCKIWATASRFQQRFFEH